MAWAAGLGPVRHLLQPDGGRALLEKHLEGRMQDGCARESGEAADGGNGGGRVGHGIHVEHSSGTTGRVVLGC